MRKVWIKFHILTYKLKLLTYTSLYDEKIIKKKEDTNTHIFLTGVITQSN